MEPNFLRKKMKTIANFVMSLVAVTLFAACGNSDKPAADAKPAVKRVRKVTKPAEKAGE